MIQSNAAAADLDSSRLPRGGEATNKVVDILFWFNAAAADPHSSKLLQILTAAGCRVAVRQSTK
jgi:hypothetical protein